MTLRNTKDVVAPGVGLIATCCNGAASMSLWASLVIVGAWRGTVDDFSSSVTCDFKNLKAALGEFIETSLATDGACEVMRYGNVFSVHIVPRYGWVDVIPPVYHTNLSLAVTQAVHNVPRWSEFGPVGIRMWRIDVDDGTLVGTTFGKWEGPSVGPAVCIFCDVHEQAAWYFSNYFYLHDHGRLGFYSFRPHAANAICRNHSSAYPTNLVGIVTHHGKVWQHTNGYRSTHARMREVWVYERVAERLDFDRYKGVEIHVLPDYE
jgi:hypothetical protein